jgi:exodeoxyribonuclease V alpha subunit
MAVVSADAPQPLDKLSGLIERVTYFNEENGFAVLQVKTSGRRDLVTVVGSLPSVSAGEWLTAEGAWVRDKEHGLQLKATALRTVPPTTTEGIEKYLGSGMVKGIGPIFATRMVEKFGAKILSVIEERSAELEMVAGIGPKRRRNIKQAGKKESAPGRSCSG